MRSGRRSPVASTTVNGARRREGGARSPVGGPVPASSAAVRRDLPMMGDLSGSEGRCAHHGKPDRALARRPPVVARTIRNVTVWKFARPGRPDDCRHHEVVWGCVRWHAPPVRGMTTPSPSAELAAQLAYLELLAWLDGLDDATLAALDAAIFRRVEAPVKVRFWSCRR